MIRVLTIAAVFAAATACTNMQSVTSSEPVVTANSRQILLTLAQVGSATIALAGSPAKRYLTRRSYGATLAVEHTLNQIAKDYGITRVDGWPIRSLDVYCEVLEVPPGIEVESILARLMNDPRVDLAQPMNFFETLTGSYDDPYLELQSSVAQLDVQRAHQLSTGKDILVAVIDSAVDSLHPDLGGRVSIVRDLVDSMSGPRGGEIHGTAVAGIIASTVNNHEGIVGIAPDVEIASLRACWPTTIDGSAARCSSFSLARALEAALDLEPEVINLSLAGPEDPLLFRLLNTAIQRGIVVVAAEPEPPQQIAGFPTSHHMVIAAHATSVWPGKGSRYLLAAPAHEILTTTPNGNYSFLSGNSLAAAHVSGVIALLMERNPTIRTEQIAKLLSDTSIQSNETQSINACRALARIIEQASCDD